MKTFSKKNIKLAVQSVLYKKNMLSILKVPELLIDYKINDWYIQRFILSNKIKDYIFCKKQEGKKIFIEDNEYQETIDKLRKKCIKMGINFFPKMEKRDNSVFLLVGDGELYTQGEKPGQKIPLGSINSKVEYFDYVSSSEHSVRYYGSYWTPVNTKNK